MCKKNYQKLPSIQHQEMCPENQIFLFRVFKYKPIIYNYVMSQLGPCLLDFLCGL